ncbi:MAG: hypothetical protein E6I93_19360 [Chloroflexi bacterium]|nr:MAG: hypothetical protein E6I93_19360 [Chloroflexota bacterium]
MPICQYYGSCYSGGFRQRPKVAILFSPVGAGPDEPKHVLLVQGLAEVDDTNLESGWKRYFAGWARRQPSARQSLARMEQAIPGYTQRALIRVRPSRFLGWPDGNFQQAPEVVEVTND